MVWTAEQTQDVVDILSAPTPGYDRVFPECDLEPAGDDAVIMMMGGDTYSFRRDHWTLFCKRDHAIAIWQGALCRG